MSEMLSRCNEMNGLRGGVKTLLDCPRARHFGKRESILAFSLALAQRGIVHGIIVSNLKLPADHLKQRHRYELRETHRVEDAVFNFSFVKSDADVKWVLAAQQHKEQHA